MIPSQMKILVQIALSFILPLSFFIAYTQLTDTIIMKKLCYYSDAPKYMIGAFGYSDWSGSMLLKATYLIFILAFSLLTTSIVVYTISGITFLLDTVITVFGGSSGIQAMIKAKELIKDKITMGVYKTFLLLHFLLYTITFYASPVEIFPWEARMGFVIIWLVSIFVQNWLCILIQIGVYLVHKSNHHHEISELYITKEDQLNVKTQEGNADIKADNWQSMMSKL